jgi:two-component system nitrogen regulation sensor histidine kinase NtrY
MKRSRFVPLIEIVTVVALIAMATISYFIITEQGTPQSLLTPPLVATLLVANLVPATALMVLVARRVAMGRAARSPIGGRGRLHVRLVALFSVIASVPTLLVVIFASLLFQSGTQFWFSDRARTVLENAERVAQIYAQENKARIERDINAMANDVVRDVNEFGVDSSDFTDRFFYQVVARDLTEAAIINVGRNCR